MMHSELLQRAHAHLAAGHFAEAGDIAKVYSREVDPLDPEPHLILSRVAHAMGRFPVAVTEAGSAVILAPGNPVFRQRLVAAISTVAMHPSAPPLLARGARGLLDRFSQPEAPKENRESGGTVNGIDLVLPMSAPYGSELNLIETAKTLRRFVPTRIWSDVQPHPRLVELDPTIQMITSDSIPSAHTLVFMGLFQKPPDWLERARAKRIVLRYNVSYTLDLLIWLGATARSSAERIDLVFASQALKDAIGVDGTVLHTFIDLEHFAVREPIQTVKVIGRLSRDEIYKHHPRDAALYRSLLEEGLEIRIMGGTQLAPFMAKHDRLTLASALAIPAQTFLHGLDLFLYRTGTFYEAFGRVVAEAMACGLPVVCHRAGGYAELIRDGENGFLFDTNEEASEIIARLRTNASALKQIGNAARETILDYNSPRSKDRLVGYFMRP